jgi:hypothetical protein
MGIPIDEPTTAGPPAVKLGQPGSYIDIGIVNVEEVQSRDFDSGDLEFWPDGKPKMHPRITGLTIQSDGMTVGDEERPIEPGELVSVYAQGGRIFAWRDAKKEHGTVQVGDVLRWKFDHTEDPKNPRFKGNPRKVITAKLRSPKGEDGDLVKRCEEAYYARANRPTVDAGISSGPVNDDPPF